MIFLLIDYLTFLPIWKMILKKSSVKLIFWLLWALRRRLPTKVASIYFHVGNKLRIVFEHANANETFFYLLILNFNSFFLIISRFSRLQQICSIIKRKNCDDVFQVFFAFVWTTFFASVIDVDVKMVEHFDNDNISKLRFLKVLHFFCHLWQLVTVSLPY